MSRVDDVQVVFVDDDADVRAANLQSLGLAGLRVEAFAAAEPALRRLDPGFDGVVVSDIRMPRLDGREFHRRLRAVDPEIPMILITGHADVADAVDAIREGVYDFIAKPFPVERLVTGVRRALEQRSLVLENRRLRRAVTPVDDELSLIGATPAMDALRSTVRQIADADVDVLIEGETGVGKEHVARALRGWGRRRAGPLVAVNCAALPDGMVERELFGHEAGAFAGATRRRAGWIESTHRGTLFLDNIESAAAPLQSALLRVLETREVVPVGGNHARAVDFRAVATASVDLAQQVQSGGFRRDLFYRLNVVRLRVPPLRERRADVPLLYAHLLAAAGRRFRREPPPLTDAVRRHLLEHDWPGNVRELGNFAERIVLGLEAGMPADYDGGPGSLPQRVERFEASLIREALVATGGDVRATLDALGIPRKTFYDKVQRFAIRLDDFRPRAARKR